MPFIHEKREHPRFDLPAMYTPIVARTSSGEELDGHVYDMSRGGLQFDLDGVVEPGESIEVRVEIPLGSYAGAAPLEATCNVVWIEDEDEPGPTRHAAVFSSFACGDAARRLERLLTGGHYRPAA